MNHCLLLARRNLLLRSATILEERANSHVAVMHDPPLAVLWVRRTDTSCCTTTLLRRSFSHHSRSGVRDRGEKDSFTSILATHCHQPPCESDLF